MLRRVLLKSVALSGLAMPALSQPGATRARTLRFMPQAALAVLDPIFNPTTIATTHGYCVFDTLYGVDGSYKPQPQMVQGHVVENDGKHWKLTLRDGMLWHDGEKVLARDCGVR